MNVPIAIYLVLGVIILINYVVWLKPNLWMKFMELGKDPLLGKNYSQEYIQRFINNPKYIIYVRSVAILAFISLLLVIVFWL